MEDKQAKVLEVINKKIMEDIGNGVGSWSSTGAKFEDKYVLVPMNYVTSYEYKGINKVLLPAGFYLTYGQLKKLGGNLKKDTDGNYPKQWTILQIWCKQFVKYSYEDKDGSLKENIMPKALFLAAKVVYKEILFEWTKTTYGYDRVYNINDCENYKTVNHTKDLVLNNNPLASPSGNRDQICDAFIKHYTDKQAIKLYENKEMSFYDRKEDSVHIKDVDTFSNANLYYEQFFHELAHSTGAEKRLNRKQDGDEGQYAREEVVAELGAIYSLNKMCLLTNDQNTNCLNYLKNWLANPKLKEDMEKDKSILIKVFNDADKAQKLIFTK